MKEFAPWLPPETFDYKYVEVNATEQAINPELTTPLYTAGRVPFYMTEPAGRSYVEFARPEDLKRALEAAYRHVAVALMYSQREMPYQSWNNANLTGAVPWTTLGAPGEAVPALLVLVLLSLWALGCMVLGLAYSFRKRWDAFLTTRSLYWYCKTTANVDPMEVMRKTNY